MIMELMAACEWDAERIRRDEIRIDELLSKVDKLLFLQKAAMVAEKKLDDYKQLVRNLLSKITVLEGRLKVRDKNLYGCKSRKDGEKHTCDKDYFDGVLQSIESPLPEHGGEVVEEEGVEVKLKEICLIVKGCLIGL